MFVLITDSAHAQVAWLSDFTERNFDWKKLKYLRYNAFHKAVDNSGRLPVMI